MERQDCSPNEPKLEFTQETVMLLVRRLADGDTLIVTDPYGYPTLKDIGRTVLVRDCGYESVKKIRSGGDYQTVLAVGGCTALDVGRACGIEKSVIAIPTILSTSCISVDRSVIKFEDGIRKSIRTIAPERTIVSIPSLLKTHIDELELWSQSGFGDLLSNISASIDVQWGAGHLDYESIRENVPECFDALDWIVNSFGEYNEDSLKRLATYVHNSSIGVIRRGDTKLSAAGEHTLDYMLRVLHPQYTERRPTHGQMVSVGTLISAEILKEQTMDDRIFHALEVSYRKLKLPTDYEGLRSIGIEKEQLLRGLQLIRKSGTYLGDHFRNREATIVNRIFGGNKYEH